MLLSSLVTPYKWYDKFYDQNRFDNDCNSVCEFALITDTRHLLPFQFKRKPSPYLMTDFVLRKCCTDPTKKVLSGADTNFVGGSMTWVDVNTIDRAAWQVNCDGGVCAIMSESEYDETKLQWTGLVIGKTYTYNIVISKYISFGSLLTFSNGATILKTFPSSGVFTGTFVATATDVFFAFSLITDLEEAFCIQYIQLEQAFEIDYDNDVVLNSDLIRYFNDGTNDYFVYCGQDVNLKMPTGCYYSILKDEGGNFYYSEVITIEDFQPEKSPYLLLEWWNTCDLKDVVYHLVAMYDPNVDVQDAGCSYINKLYLPDGVLTRPEYPFKEDGEEDGQQTFNPTFQKMDKEISLIVGRCPEYIIDSLNAVRLHDTIQFYKPLRKNQELIDDAIPVISTSAEQQYIFNDCFANVTLKMLLDEKFVDETCCVEIEKDECMGCVDAGELDVFNEDVYDYALILLADDSDSDFTQPGLYHYNGTDWVYLEPDEDLLICTSDGRRWQYQPTNPLGLGSWGYVPTVGSGSLTYVAHVSGNIWNVKGSINSHSYGMIQYSTNGGVSWIDTSPKFTYTDIFINFPVTFPFNPCCGDFLVRIKSFDLNGCDYGVSNSYTATSPTNDCC